MKNTFKMLINDQVIKISESQYKELVEADQALLGGSISLVTDGGLTYTYIPYKDVRHAQVKPLELKLPPMSDEEKADYLKKFTDYLSKQQMHVKYI